MRNQNSLTEQIINIVRVAGRCSASDIRRALPGLVDAADVSCRLSKLVNSGRIIATQAPATAITGPRTIKIYSMPDVVQLPLTVDDHAHFTNADNERNIFQLLPQTQ